MGALQHTFGKGNVWTLLSQNKTFNLVSEGHSFVCPDTALDDYLPGTITATTFYNGAVSGATVADCVTRQATTDSKLISETSSYKNILSLWIGANNITNSVGSGASTYAAMKSYIQARVAAGWKVYVFTCTPATAGGLGAQFEIERNTFNGLMRSDLALLSNVFVLDTDTITQLANPANTSYYSDARHPTALGAWYASTLFTARIVANYGNTALPIDPETTFATLTVASTGTGAGVATMALTSSERTILTLDGNAKFYRDIACTQGETSVWVVIPSAATPYNRTIYIKNTSGTANLKIEKNKISGIRLWTASTNAPSLGGSIATLTDINFMYAAGLNTLSGSVAGLTTLKYLYVDGQNTLSGSVAGLTLLTTLRVRGSNTISGSIAALTSLTTIYAGGSNTLSGSIADLTLLTFLRAEGSNTISGSIAALTKLTYLFAPASGGFSGSIAALTKLTDVYVVGANTISGSIAALTLLTYISIGGSNTLTGAITALTLLTTIDVTGNNTISGDLGGTGTAAVANGVTTLTLTPCGMNTYTAGATWSLTGSTTINPAVSYGYDSTQIDNIIIDMAASLGTVINKTITLKGASAARTAASNAAVATLLGKGWTVVTN